MKNKEIAYIKVAISEDGLNFINMQILGEIVEKKPNGSITVRIRENGEEVLRDFDNGDYSLQPMRLPYV